MNLELNEDNINAINRLDDISKEFIKYCIELGVMTNENKDYIINRLSKTKIKYVSDKPYGGYAYKDGDDIVVEICKDTLIKEATENNRVIDEYIDENIYHELIHTCSLLGDEIFQKLSNCFSNYDIIKFPVDRGYSIVNEYVAQSLSQKIVECKYKDRYTDKNMFEKRTQTFVYNENNHIDENESIQYEYVSDLDFYGEIENFAIKFLSTIYKNLNITEVYIDCLNDNFLDKIAETYREKTGGIEKLYTLFETMGTIIVCDYFQQGYYGPEYIKNYEEFLSKDNFSKNISTFNNIADSLRKDKNK